MSELEILEKQHYDNYIKAIKEIIRNNSDALFDIDITSLIKTPPLDSMDIIKGKLLSLAKNKNIILNTSNLNKLVNNYRNDVLKKVLLLKKNRIDFLDSEIESMITNGDKKIIKLSKKSINTFNSKFRKNIRKILEKSIEHNIINNFNDIFQYDEDFNDIDEMKNKMAKYLGSRGIYQKQFFESIDFKILVKDTILINGIKEQGDRYVFTINNSRIFEDNN